MPSTFSKICVLILLIFNFAIKLTAQDLAKRFNSPDPLTGYRLLNLPREDISIGANWIEKYGPSGTGAKSNSYLSYASLDQYEIDRHKDLSLNIKAMLAKFLGLNVSHSNETNQKIELKELQIVRLDSLDKLNYASGSIFIWEGIKVKSFSITGSKDKLDTVVLNLKKLKNQDSLQINVGNTLSNTLTVKGSNLFIAYRLVKFGEIQSELILRPERIVKTSGDRTTVTYKTQKGKQYIRQIYRPRPVDFSTGKAVGPNQLGGFNMEDIYEGKFFTKLEFQNTFPNLKPKNNIGAQNELVLLINCNNEIISGEPKRIAYNLNNGDKSEDLEFLLSAKLKGQFYTIEKLKMFVSSYYPNTHFPVDDSYAQTILSVKRINIPIENFTDNNAPGW